MCVCGGGGGRYLRDAAAKVLGEGDLETQGKAIVAAFLCSCAILKTFLGPDFNPFTPIHNAMYTITGIPKPEAGGSPPTAAEKPKED